MLPSVLVSLVVDYTRLAHLKNELRLVQQDSSALQNVKEQTHEICLAAVQQNGLALKYIKEQTREICLAAISQNRYVL